MANRIAGNVYILDTASGNVTIPWPGKMKIESVLFWASTTAGRLILTEASTADAIVSLGMPEVGVGGGNNGQYLGGVEVQELKVLTLTAGTAWLYLK